MGRGLILRRQLPWRGRLSQQGAHSPPTDAVLAILSDSYPPPKGRLPTCYSPVRHFTHGRSHFLVRLACVRPAANVRSEPGSNSPVFLSQRGLWSARIPTRELARGTCPRAKRTAALLKLDHSFAIQFSETDQATKLPNLLPNQAKLPAYKGIQILPARTPLVKRGRFIPASPCSVKSYFSG